MKQLKTSNMTIEQFDTVDRFWDNYQNNREKVHYAFGSYMGLVCNNKEEADRIINLEKRLISPAEFILGKDEHVFDGKKHLLNSPGETQLGLALDKSQLEDINMDEKSFLRKRSGYGIDVSPYYNVSLSDLERSKREGKIPAGFDVYLKLFCDFAVYESSRKLPMHVAHAIFTEVAQSYSRLDMDKSKVLKNSARTIEKMNQLTRCALERQILSRAGFDKSISRPKNKELQQTITRWEETGVARKAYTNMADWRKFIMTFNIPEEQKTLIRSTRLFRTHNTSFNDEQARRESSVELLNKELGKILNEM